MKTQQEVEFGSIIKNALLSAVRLNEKVNVEVHILVLECDGLAACLGLATTCASLALMNAGIEMMDSVVASTVGFVRRDNETVIALDCDENEETHQKGYMFMAYMPNMNQVAHVVQVGEVSLEKAVKSIEICTDASMQLYAVIRKLILEEKC